MPQRGRNAGNKGQGSKWISKKTRHRIYARDGWRCVWCGCGVYCQTKAAGQEFKITYGPNFGSCLATLDHVIPRALHGTNQVSNLITSCMKCNRDRGDDTAEEYARKQWREGNAELLGRVLRAVCSPLPPAA